jgi:TonB family protein
MISTIGAIMLAASNSPAASILAKVTLTTAIGLIAARLAYRRSAAVRHALLAATFAILLILPIAALLTRPRRIPIAIAPQSPRVSAPVPATTAAIHPAVAASPAPSLATILLTIWLAGSIVFLVPVAISLWQVRSLHRSALPARRGQSIADALTTSAGHSRRPAVLLHEAVPGPITCGLLRPAIILSRDAQAWDDESLARAILHELEHVRRSDWFTQCLARTLCAVYWFHPLVWMAWRRLALEAERACDDEVLNRFEATAYADQLVGLAKRLSAVARSPLLAMANRADLSTRVAAVLDPRQPRGRAGAPSVLLAGLVAATLVIAVSPLVIVSAQQSSVPRFLARTQLVTVTVTVSDGSGKPVEGLGANDFVLTEDNVPQKISFFEFQAVPQNSVPSYYVLGYYTANTGQADQFHKIEVTRKNDSSAKLSFRQGYYTSANPAPAPTPAPGSKGQAALDFTPPQLLYKVEPEYSEEARKAKYQGIVLLDVEIDASGLVADARVTHAIGLGLDEKALEAVRKWKFRPAMKNGAPIATHSEVGIVFRLL